VAESLLAWIRIEPAEVIAADGMFAVAALGMKAAEQAVSGTLELAPARRWTWPMLMQSTSDPKFMWVDADCVQRRLRMPTD
jgi:hypothetical protein